jgi:hypothetical protein
MCGRPCHIFVGSPWRRRKGKPDPVRDGGLLALLGSMVLVPSLHLGAFKVPNDGLVEPAVAARRRVTRLIHHDLYSACFLQK